MTEFFSRSAHFCNRSFRLNLMIVLALSLPLSIASAQEVKSVSLDDAIVLALQSSPRLEASAASVAASQGDRQQAGAWQNPEILIQAENFMGDGVYKGYDGAETTVGISQRLETGGKIGRRIAVAEEGIALSRYEYDIEKLTLISEIRTAYANAVAAQERLKMAKEQQALAKKILAEVTVRVNAAREPEIQKSKAQIILSTADFATEKATRELDHTLHILTSLWGGHDSDVALKTDYFFEIQPPMTEQEAEGALENSALMRRMNAEQNKMQALHGLERAQAVPDPTVGVGIRDFRGTENQALLATLSFPLPVLNHNKGGIERARANAMKAASQTHATRLSLVNELHEALENMTNDYENVSNIRKSILPAAERSFSLSRKAYNAGKLPYLEVMDAQRTLADIREQYIDTLNDYHKSWAILDRLTGTNYDVKEARDENK